MSNYIDSNQIGEYGHKFSGRQAAATEDPAALHDESDSWLLDSLITTYIHCQETEDIESYVFWRNHYRATHAELLRRLAPPLLGQTGGE